jgi:hypothetical protein
MAISSPALALVLAGVLLAGCSGQGSEGIFTTGSLTGGQPNPPPEPKVDPVCVSLVSRIETLRKEGIADKIEKAAIKRYRLTHSDLGKVDQLTKASAELQLRCTTITPTAAQPPPAAPAAKTAAAKDKTVLTVTASP